MYKRPSAARSSIDDVIAPVNGVRDAMRRKGVKPRDHARDNVRALREVQRAHREARETARDGSKEFKLKKFQNVKSRVAVSREGDVTSRTGAGGETKRFLKKGTRPDPSAKPARPFRRKEENKKPAVPKAHETAALAPRTETDFIRGNAVEVIHAAPAPHAGDRDVEEAKPASYGRVPKYLEERKAAVAEAKRRELERKGDPDCPPGMRMMPDIERVETLKVLQASQDEVKQQLFKMPLVIETAGQVRRKNALEGKLKEIEDAIKIFNRPKVFVADD